MMWKIIGASVIGTSHKELEWMCDDAHVYQVVQSGDDGVLICCVSDGAGSANYGGEAAELCTKGFVAAVSEMVAAGRVISEKDIYTVAESLYDQLMAVAERDEQNANEYSCTLLGCCIGAGQSLFFQVGDGAIVRNDGAGYYVPLWWPQQGEYNNTTHFLIDDSSLGQLSVLLIPEEVQELAIFTDGLQMLALNMQEQAAHQPFFADMFRYLRQADSAEKIEIAGSKLKEFLNSKQVNDRTDDDKTLFLATRL